MVNMKVYLGAGVGLIATFTGVFGNATAASATSTPASETSSLASALVPAEQGAATPFVSNAASWGPNWDGWEVRIDNASTDRLNYDPGVWDNVRAHSDVMSPGETGHVKGDATKIASLRGPANIDFSYLTPPDPWPFHAGTAHIVVAAPDPNHMSGTQCTATGTLECKITVAAPDKEVIVTISDSGR